ncbi:MAG: hypothetical protein VKP63_01430 [Cyanobacteriota bacterium]|nr:hypothetical protein [Cyanobacteriota bacterium]
MNKFSRRVLSWALGSAGLLVGLNAGMASALDFNFTFSGNGNPTDPAVVSGLITGLVDNVSNQKNVTISITSATNSPAGGWPTFTGSNWVSEDGFDVVGGLITEVDVKYINGDSQLYLGNYPGSQVYPELYYDAPNFPTNVNYNRNVQFTPVPGPLPIIGAAVAFRTTRQLRRRCKAAA